MSHPIHHIVCYCRECTSPAEANAELLRLLERHHEESHIRDRFIQEGAELYVGTKLYFETEAAIERAKEKV